MGFCGNFLYSIFLTLKDKEEFGNIENDLPYIENHLLHLKKRNACSLRNNGLIKNGEDLITT